MNFALGHVEAADLYEVRDNKGRRHAVMVPDVCGNVSVLGNRAERGPASRLAQALTERGLSTGRLDAVLKDSMLVTAPADPGGPFTAAEPGTLAAVLLALGLLWALRRRQDRRVGAAPGSRGSSHPGDQAVSRSAGQPIKPLRPFIPPMRCIIFIMPPPFIFFIMPCICSNCLSMRLTS